MCLSNNKQLVLAWHLYAGDFNETCCNNFTIPDTISAITSGKLNNWVNNIMTFTDTAYPVWQSVTNVEWVKSGVLARYTTAALPIYKCPADNYLSPQQRKAGFPARLRSNSMNALFGRSDNLPTSANGRSWADQAYRQFLKTSDVPQPAMTWLTLDEQADSANDAFFINGRGASTWSDLPASYHNGACSFSFSDGHAEIHKWLSRASIFPVKANGSLPPNPGFTAANRGKLDFQWYDDRVQWIRFQ
jgi:prepilin-type processing-associated H-X9-DG protein